MNSIIRISSIAITLLLVIVGGAALSPSVSAYGLNIASPMSSSSTNAGQLLQSVTANIHPTQSTECLEDFLHNSTVDVIPCVVTGQPFGGPPSIHTSSSIKPAMTMQPMTSISFSPTLNCNYAGSSTPYHCWAGYYYTASGPYTGLYDDYLDPTSAPSTAYSTPFASFWIGLQNSAGSILVQSGIFYGDSAISGYSSAQPEMFTEIVGSFNYNGKSCASNFCGTTTAVSVGDWILPGEYLQSGYWYASVCDQTTGVCKQFTTSQSSLGVSSLGQAEGLFEGYSLTSNSMLPSLPVSANTISIWTSPSTQISINLNSWSQLAYPTSTTGISFSSIQMDTTPTETWG